MDEMRWPEPEEQIADYLVEHRDQLLNGSLTKTGLAEHCQVSKARLGKALRLAGTGLAQHGLVVLELMRANRYVVLCTSDVAAYRNSMIPALRTMVSWLGRLCANVNVLAPEEASRYEPMLRSLTDLLEELQEA